MDYERLTAQQRVEMYVSPTCPYCVQAQTYFAGRAIPVTVYDAQNDRAHRAAMFGYTGDDPTVPAIVVDGVYTGSGWGSPPKG